MANLDLSFGNITPSQTAATPSVPQQKQAQVSQASTTKQQALSTQLDFGNPETQRDIATAVMEGNNLGQDAEFFQDMSTQTDDYIAQKWGWAS